MRQAFQPEPAAKKSQGVRLESLTCEEGCSAPLNNYDYSSEWMSLKDSGKQILSYNFLQYRDTEARTAAHLEIAVFLNPWISDQFMLHRRFMRFEIHASALSGYGKQVDAGSGVQSAAPGVSTEI